jgi:hypothetical protein
LLTLQLLPLIRRSLRLESFGFTLVLGAEPFKRLLLLRLSQLTGLLQQREHWHLIGIQSCLTPSAHLLREEAAHTAVGTEFDGV